ncbi:hypothetical protein H072_2068 [Dactylellina haptotyla CBS 200.50]|uniref:BCAS3 domain-containing protein n=1 Tax=Dactylellina haptotyla (strain CBS 200.50) TaxID=1284197 RepID=S8C8I6_DACHA|nr:hypothetical protein H072_2068 [Dactylellina haptotyla CBS 200.50]
MPRRKPRRSDNDSNKTFPQVQPQQVQQKTTSPLLSAFASASSIPFNLLGNSPPPSISPQLLGTSPNHHLQQGLIGPAGEYGNHQNHISIPNSFPRSYPNQVGGAPHAISPPTGAGGAGRALQHHVSYPSFPEHRGSSVYATSPTPSHLSGRGGARPPAHAGHLRPGDGGWAFSFDVLDDLEGLIGSESAQKASGSGVVGTDVVCLGWEGGVDVWKVGRGVVELVARMSGLPGTVIGAKLLPTPRRDDANAHLRPLICLVIHSPVLPRQDDDEHERSPTPSENSRPASAASNRSSEHLPQQPAEEYQTSVEIYSLSRRTHVATLYKSPLIPVAIGGIPAPLGVRVEVSNVGTGNVIAVGIAGTGEIFLFSDSKPAVSRKRRSEVTEDRTWHCWGKVWTNVYVEGRSSSSGNLSAEYNSENLPSCKAGMPIFSLEGRWLAYCPPSPSSQALRMGNSFPSVGGVATGAPHLPNPSAPQPQANTYVDVPEDEPILNRVAREVTQEVIRGAKWMGEQGIRAMKNYWNGYNSSGNSNGNSPPGAGVKIGPNPAGTNGVSALGMQVQEMRERERELASLGPGSGISSGKNGYGMQSGGNNAGLATANSSEPVVISIMDLGKGMAQSYRNEALTPQTTFQPLQGASFVSFAPGGMALLVVSNKGDVVHVWDLLKAMHQPPVSATAQSKSKASPSVTDASAIAVNGRLANGQHAGRHVRQIARFTRMTVAHVVDVVWSGPKGDKLAIVTEKGTVHFYDMPGNAYQWPPPKRSIPQPKSPQGGVSGMVSSAGQAAASLLTNAQPLVVAARRRRRSSSGSVSGYGTSTGKDSTLGSSGNSVAQANAIVHRVSLPYGPGTPGMGFVRFLGGKEYGYVAMIGGGTLRIYESKASAVARRKSAPHDGGVITTGWLEYELPGLPEGTAAGVQEPLEDDNDEPMSPISVGEELTKPEPTVLQGYWGGKTPAPPPTTSKNKELQKELIETPLSYAEIDTNPPYPPIHSDRHVTLSIFKEESSIAASTTWHLNVAQSNDAVWVFGRNIPFEKLDIGFAKGEVEFVESSDGLVEAMESGMRLGEQSQAPPKPLRQKAPRVSTPPRLSETPEEPMIYEIPSSTTVNTLPKSGKKDGVSAVPEKKKKKKGKRIEPPANTFGDEGFFEEGAEVLDENQRNK